MKAVSPLIATVLLIGFAFTVGLILIAWLTEMGKEQSEYITKAGEQTIQCTLAKFDILKPTIKYNFSANTPYINITVINTGKFDLYNFSFSVLTKKGALPKSYIFIPENQITKSSPLKAGRPWVFNTVPESDKPSSDEKITEILATAICGEDFVVKNSVRLEV